MHMLTYRAQRSDGRLGFGHRRRERSRVRRDSDCQTTRRPCHQLDWFHGGQNEISPRVWARDWVVDSGGADWPAEVRKITGKRGVDLVVEHVGGEVLAKCFDCLARGGSVVTCGATAGREVPLKLWSFFVKEQKLIGSYGRRRADILAALQWAAAA